MITYNVVLLDRVQVTRIELAEELLPFPVAVALSVFRVPSSSKSQTSTYYMMLFVQLLSMEFLHACRREPW